MIVAKDKDTARMGRYRKTVYAVELRHISVELRHISVELRHISVELRHISVEFVIYAVELRHISDKRFISICFNTR